MNAINTLNKLFPKLRKERSEGAAPLVVPKGRLPVKESVVLEGVLDISLEANDALAPEGRQAMGFEITFPPASPTDSSGSCSSTLNSKGARPLLDPPASPHAHIPLPLAVTPPLVAATPTLRDVLPSELGGRRNFKGRCLDTSLPLSAPPMSTHLPHESSSTNRTLRRQSELIALNAGRRSNSLPLSRHRTSQSNPAQLSLVVDWDSDSDSEDSSDEALDDDSSKGMGKSKRLEFPLPPRRTFTKRYAPQSMPNSATREMFTIGEAEVRVEPLHIVKRESGSESISTRTARSTMNSDLVMDELFLTLDDVYEEFRNGSDESPEPASRSSWGSNSPPYIDEPDDWDELGTTRGLRIRYSLAEEEFRQVPPPYRTVRGDDPRWMCAHSFLVARKYSLGSYSALGSQSLPDLTRTVEEASSPSLPARHARFSVVA
ncbi:hypothetical protein C8J57DRAFT_1216832 [Mycena rebaudengoi]|nr:hypothetical protein C8J57DRAFT_1216832 [Mycena rebaudengoi]